MSEYRAFTDYLKALRARGAPVTDEQMRELRARFDALAADRERFPGGEAGGNFYGRAPLPDWRLLEVEFAPSGDLASRPATGARAAKHANHRGGPPDTFYPRDQIVRVLRARHDHPERVTPRSLERPGFSRKAVRRVQRLADLGAWRLGPRGGLRWAGSDGVIRAVPERVSLRAIERAWGLEPLG